VAGSASRWAFTLAEVLITLGIIGVVAAMTMPVLIQNHRKSVVETRLSKFYSSINQALKLAENDYGEMIYWDEIGTGWAVNDDGSPDNSRSTVVPWFEKYLKPYLVYTSYKVDDIDGRVLVYFPDGGMVRLCLYAFIFYPDPKLYEKKYNDTIYGKESFTFFFSPTSNTASDSHHKNKGVEPYKHAWDGDRDKLFNDSTYGCKSNPTNDQGAYCTALIQMNGWKIPKDYPLKF